MEEEVKKSRRKQWSLKCVAWEIDPPSWLIIVITIFTRDVRTSVCPHFSKYRKTNQISSENSDPYWWDCGSGKGGHWWHLSCLKCSCFLLKLHITLILLDPQTFGEMAWRWLAQIPNSFCSAIFAIFSEDYIAEEKCYLKEAKWPMKNL